MDSVSFFEIVADSSIFAGAFDKAKAKSLEFAAAFKARTRDEWAEIFLPSDACVAPVLSLKEAAVHPYNTEREVFLEQGGHLQPAPAPRFSRTPGAVEGLPALPGADSRAILTELGFPDAETLLQSGAIVQA